MNGIKFKSILCTLLWLGFYVSVNAQQSKGMDSLNYKLALYGIKNQAPVLFVHFDKNVYSNNETAWFTAYLLNTASYAPYNLLSVALVKDDDRAVVLENKFLIKNGLCFGNSVIPNSVSPGNYSFIATTNRLVNGRPEVVFTQPITIKTADQQEFVAALTALDTAAAALQQKVLLNVSFLNQANVKQNPPPVAVISYYVGNTARPVVRGFGKTENNKYALTIPSKLIGPGNNWLHVQIQYKKDVKEVTMALPVPPRPAIVRFYPEGGNMVNNLQSTIGWEVLNAAGKPLGVNALLYQGEKIIDTLSTNSYGLGKFALTPKPGSSYYVKLYKVNKTDTLYKLPTALAQGPVLSLPNAIVNDTLTVNLKSATLQKLYLIGHNYNQMLFVTPVVMNAFSKKIKLVIKDIPKGLTQLMLTDSTGRPFAERIFFAHYDRRVVSTISTDREEYTTRQPVNVKLKLTTKLPDSGFVSIACVQENRMAISKKNDIESYLYLKHDLQDIPLRGAYLGDSEADKQFMENLLLIKGWRRFKWTDVLRAQPQDTIRKYTQGVFKGTVTQYNKPLSKPVGLMNISSPLTVITTGNTGTFTLNYNDLLTDSGKKAKFMVKEPDPTLYTIRLADPYTIVNEMLATQLQPKDYTATGQENTNYMQVPNNEHAIQLKEVDIKGNNDNAFYGRGGFDSRNESKIIGNPVTQTMGERTITTQTNYVVTGSVDYKLELNGIYSAQEFYLADYSKNPGEPAFISTLYWKHLVKVSSVKNAELLFFTGDITGKFKIIVQGITANDVTYGETTFNVIKSK